MKTLVLAALLVSAPAFADEVTVPLLPEEITLATGLVEKYHVPAQVRGACAKTEFQVTSRVRGFNPARWSLISSRGTTTLSGPEIQGLIRLVDRVGVPMDEVDEITTEIRAKVTGDRCGQAPSTWSITFDDLT